MRIGSSRVRNSHSKNSMRILLAPIVLTFILFTSPLTAKDCNDKDSLTLLRKEIVQFIKKHNVEFADSSLQDVTIGFMINAKKEIIVLDVKGDNTAVCAHLKEALNYRTVKFNQSRQLIRYSITVQLLGSR